ncbi:uncharacterized protein JCM6883_001436 [Sporobolomyces salmoneus]|uniref:uncharacterized protein n=1 Tax=Sporobolomyces salmoneus TaxID=183962 RepID=UPI00317F1946
MDPQASTSAPVKPKKQRASTSTKNRARSPSPYRSTAETNPDEFMQEFWNHTLDIAEAHEDDFKHQALPLARIKKVAKMDPDVQMISSEVTVLFEKACQIFIQELTARAHLVSIESKRRTISRTDVAQAVGKSDTFDFLIDIVPREERNAAASGSGSGGSKDKDHSSKEKDKEKDPTTTSASASGGGGGKQHQTRSSIAVPSADNIDGNGRPPIVIETGTSTSKRPTRNRRTSEKARMMAEEQEEYLDQPPPTGVEQSSANGNREGGGGGGAIYFENPPQPQPQPHAHSNPADEFPSTTKRARINPNEPTTTGGEIETERMQDEEEMEEDETDGAFEGWDGLELGFK